MSAKGKIARLPFALRQQLNQRMRDGDPDVELVEWLNSLPAVREALEGAAFGGRRKTRQAITSQNISEYRKGGYQDWVDTQDKVDRAKALAELSYELAAASGGNVSETMVRVTAGKIYTALETANGDDLCKLTAALTGLSAAETAALRARIDDKRLGVQQQSLSLERAKFERQTAELFLKFYADKRAQEIAEGKATKSVKIDQLRQMMFGEITHERTDNPTA